MAKHPPIHLSRRERQIMDILYAHGRASAQDVLEDLPDPPSYSAVRALLRILVEKGHLKHERKGARYIFEPTITRAKAKRSALQRLLQTFFDGSTEQAVAALLEHGRATLSQEDLDRLARLIKQARQKGG